MPLDPDGIDAVTFDSLGTLIFLDADETYDELHRLALEYVLAERGISVSDEEITDITDVSHEMDTFEDVRPAMEALQGRLRPGDRLERRPADARLAGSRDRRRRVPDRDGQRRRNRAPKPAVALYEHAADRLDARPSNAVHVSDGQFDVQGAIHAGMGGVWVDRQDSQPEPFGPDPDLEIDSLDEFVDRPI